MYPIGEPNDWERLLKYQEASRTQALVVSRTGVTRVVEEDAWLGGVDAAIDIARSTESFICVVVAHRFILDAMQAQDLDLGSPTNAVGQLASKLVEQHGWAQAVFAFAFSSAQLVSALDVVDRDGRPLLRVGRQLRRAEPDVVVRARRRLVPGRSRRRSGLQRTDMPALKKAEFMFRKEGMDHG